MLWGAATEVLQHTPTINGMVGKSDILRATTLEVGSVLTNRKLGALPADPVERLGIAFACNNHRRRIKPQIKRLRLEVSSRRSRGDYLRCVQRFLTNGIGNSLAYSAGAQHECR